MHELRHVLRDATTASSTAPGRGVPGKERQGDHRALRRHRLCQDVSAVIFAPTCARRVTSTWGWGKSAVDATDHSDRGAGGLYGLCHRVKCPKLPATAEPLDFERCAGRRSSCARTTWRCCCTSATTPCTAGSATVSTAWWNVSLVTPNGTRQGGSSRLMPKVSLCGLSCRRRRGHGLFPVPRRPAGGRHRIGVADGCGRRQ